METESEQTTSLINVERLNPLEVFTKEGVDPIIAEITKKVKEFKPDVSSNKGRKEIASMANKVARSKTLLDELGKKLVSEWKQKAAVVDSSRKKIRDELDELKTLAREPLTKWENEENERVTKLKNKVIFIQDMTKMDISLKVEEIQAKIDSLNSIIIDETWQEFQAIAQSAKDSSMELLRVQLNSRIENDRQQAELARLRRQEQEHMAREHERHLKEIEEKQRSEKIKLDLRRAELEKNVALEAQKQAEERARLAEENAKREAESFVRREQERREAEKSRIEAEKIQAEQMAKTKEEKVKLATQSICSEIDIKFDVAKKVVLAIASGQIPGLKFE